MPTFSVNSDFPIIVPHHKSPRYSGMPAVGDNCMGITIVLPEGKWFTVFCVIPQLKGSNLSWEWQQVPDDGVEINKLYHKKHLHISFPGPELTITCVLYIVIKIIINPFPLTILFGYSTFPVMNKAATTPKSAKMLWSLQRSWDILYMQLIILELLPKNLTPSKQF